MLVQYKHEKRSDSCLHYLSSRKPSRRLQWTLLSRTIQSFMGLLISGTLSLTTLPPYKQRHPSAKQNVLINQRRKAFVPFAEALIVPTPLAPPLGTKSPQKETVRINHQRLDSTNLTAFQEKLDLVLECRNTPVEETLAPCSHTPPVRTSAFCFSLRIELIPMYLPATFQDHNNEDTLRSLRIAVERQKRQLQG